MPFTLSTMSICSIEDVAAHTTKPFWFQMYVKDRNFIEKLIERAKAARCSTLVLTLPNILNMMTKPRWCMGMLGTKRRHFGNIVGHAESVTDMSSLSSWTAQQFGPGLSWNGVEWIKKLWGGKLIIKGILDAEDAHLAADSGADALIVSNHGGRQLDGAPSSISMLPLIRDAVGDRIEIHMDGGSRSGQDALKAIALGAKGIYIGRAFLYGLGAQGEAGVRKCLEMLYREINIIMAFCGHTDIKKVDQGILLR